MLAGKTCSAYLTVPLPSLQTLGVGVPGLCLTCPALHAGINRVTCWPCCGLRLAFKFMGLHYLTLRGSHDRRSTAGPLKGLGVHCCTRHTRAGVATRTPPAAQRNTYRISRCMRGGVSRGFSRYHVRCLQAVLIGCANALIYRTRKGKH
jgi:hypothetical protein